MNSENNLNNENLRAEQSSMFEEATYLEIDHNSPKTNETVMEEERTGGNKLKILAALGIVAMAGYIAYWVQEPVQIKADVLGSNTVAQASTEKDVTITLYGFEPANLAIDKGTVVKWTNTSSEDQSLIGASQDGDGFTSPVLSTGQTFSFTFDKDATFQYYSTYNPALKATITVGTGGTTATAPADQSSQTSTTTNTTSTQAATTTTTPTTTTSATTPASDTTTNAATLPATSTTTDNTSTSTSADATTPSLFSSLNGTSTNGSVTTDNSNTNGLPATTSVSATTVAESASSIQNGTVAQSAELRGTAYDGKLAKTGPEDGLYVLAFGLILYFNRKKLFAALQK